MNEATDKQQLQETAVARGDQESMVVEEAFIQQRYVERQKTLQETLSTLRNLAEQADMFGRIVDMSDISSFDGPSDWGSLFDERTGQDRAFIYPGATAAVYVNETEFRRLRAVSRAFAIRNPYWLSVEHNAMTHIVGSGHTYKVRAKKGLAEGVEVPDDLPGNVMKEIDDFRKKNRWGKRQGERVKRKHRDGEFLLRFYEDNPDGVLRVRFIEPLLILTPPGKGPQDDVWFGIQYEGDYEEPKGYYVRPANYLGNTVGIAGWSQMVPAEQVMHRTANVDLSSPRGLPTTFAVMANCRQAVKTLRNMGALVEFRSKIALIRTHVNATASTVKQLLQDNPGSAGNSQPSTLDRYPKAAILDVNDQTKYEFPTAQTDVEKIVASIQAELRAAAARVGFPEYMVSGDASNANFSSTMVAEGPAVKTFEVEQQDMIDDDLEIMERAIRLAIAKGRLPEDTLDLIVIDAEPPLITTRDRLKDTQADEILLRNKIASVQTIRARNNLDNEEEQAQIELEKDADAAYGLDDNLRPDAVDPALTGPPQSLDPDPASAWLDPSGGKIPMRTKEGVAVWYDPLLRTCSLREDAAVGPAFNDPPGLVAKYVAANADTRQTNHFECGAAAFACINRIHGVEPKDIETCAKWLGTTVERSTSPRAIIAQAANEGLPTEARSGMTIADLSRYVRGGTPVMIPGQYYAGRRDPRAAWNYGHWLTVLDVTRDFVICHDSGLENLEHKPGGDVPKSQQDKEGNVGAAGILPIAWQDFMDRWHDVGEPGPNGEPGIKYERYGIAIGPPTGAPISTSGAKT